MTRRWMRFLLPWAAACAAAPPPSAPRAAAPLVAAPAAAVPCKPARAAAEGLEGCMPGEPEFMITDVEAGGSMRGLVAPVDAGAGQVAWFSFMRVLLPGLEAPLRAAPAPPWDHVKASRPFEMNGYPALEAEGTDEGYHKFARLVAIGINLFVAEVSVPVDARVDLALIERFLGSFHVEIPWRLHTSPEGRFSVAIPAPAAFQEGEDSMPNGQPVPHVSFTLGSREERSYQAVALPLLFSQMSSRDELMDTTARAFVTKLGGVILSKQSLQNEDAPVSEILARDGTGKHHRLRVLVQGGQLYLFDAVARSAEALDDADTERFLQSFQSTAR